MRNTTIRLLIAAVLVFIWLKLVDVSQLVVLISQVELIWLVPILIILIGILFLSVYRFQLLLKPEFRVPYFYLMKLNVVGSIASIFAPANAGGFLRAFLLKSKVKSSYSSVFGYILADFLVSVLTALLMGIFGLVYFGFVKNIFPSDSVILIPVLIIAAGFIFLSKPKWGKVLTNFLIINLSPVRFRKRLKSAVDDFWKAYINLSSDLPKLALIFSISFTMHLLFGVSIYFLFRSFGVFPSILSVVLANSIFSFINIIPTVPAKVGQYELVGLLVFTNLLNLETNLVGAATLLSHVFGLTFILSIFAVIVVVFGRKDLAGMI